MGVVLQPLSTDVIESRVPDGFGFHFKVKGTNRLYRLGPTRDPRQPRFWCFRIYRCTTGGVADPQEQPWLVGGGLDRDKIAAAIDEIRADLDGWLARDENEPIRDWIRSSLEEQPAVVSSVVVERADAGARATS